MPYPKVTKPSNYGTRAQPFAMLNYEIERGRDRERKTVRERERKRKTEKREAVNLVTVPSFPPNPQAALGRGTQGRSPSVP